MSYDKASTIHDEGVIGYGLKDEDGQGCEVEEAIDSDIDGDHAGDDDDDDDDVSDDVSDDELIDLFEDYLEAYREAYYRESECWLISFLSNVLEMLNPRLAIIEYYWASFVSEHEDDDEDQHHHKQQEDIHLHRRHMLQIYKLVLERRPNDPDLLDGIKMLEQEQTEDQQSNDNADGEVNGHKERGELSDEERDDSFHNWGDQKPQDPWEEHHKEDQAEHQAEESAYCPSCVNFWDECSCEGRDQEDQNFWGEKPGEDHEEDQQEDQQEDQGEESAYCPSCGNYWEQCSCDGELDFHPGDDFEDYGEWERSIDNEKYADNKNGCLHRGDDHEEYWECWDVHKQW